MPEESESRVARHALKFVGDVKKGKYLPGIPAQDFTEEQAEVWFDDEKYARVLDSGFYEEANKTETKAIESAAADQADATDAAPETEAPARAKARK